MSDLCSFVPDNFLHDLKDLKILGTGSYGRVHLVEKNFEYYAIKFSSLSKDRFRSDLLNEINTLTYFRQSRNIIHLIGICLSKTKHQIAIILEPANMNLREFIWSNLLHIRIGYFPLLTKSLLEGLKTLRAFKVAHFDLKPDNILVKNLAQKDLDFGSRIEFKIADFGLSRFIYSSQEPPLNEVFSLNYRPPEFLSSRERTSFDLLAGDLWSAGLILAEYITMITPFRSETESETLEEIRKSSRPDLTKEKFIEDINTGRIVGKVHFKDLEVLKNLEALKKFTRPFRIDELGTYEKEYLLIEQMLSLNPEERSLALFLSETTVPVQYISEHLNSEEPRRADPEGIRIILSNKLNLPPGVRIIALELFTRFCTKHWTQNYLDLTSKETAIIVLMIISNYTTLDVSKALELLYPQYNKLQENLFLKSIKFLKAINFQIYNTNLTPVIQRFYAKRISLDLFQPDYYSHQLDDWFNLE